LLCLGLTMGTIPSKAFRVFMHVGHDFSAEELKKSHGWKEVAARADGVWAFDAWTRTLQKKKDQDKVLGHLKSRKFYVAEVHWGPTFVGKDRRRPNEVIDPGERNKFDKIWCMTYDESRYGSTMSKEQIDQYRKIYPDYKLITNIRVFNKNRFAEEFAALDGMSYEFNALTYQETTPHHPGQTQFENIVEAIRWCLDNDKMIFLLIPPGNKKGQKTEKNFFIKTIKQLILDLGDELEEKDLLNDNLVLVPATYDCRQREVHNTPEKKDGTFANTGMGATLIAIEYRDKPEFFKRRRSKEKDIKQQLPHLKK